MKTFSVTNEGTVYRIHVAWGDPVDALVNGGPLFFMAETGWSSGHGEWISVGVGPIEWSYIEEKMPLLAKREGDKPGWIKAFKAAGLEVFG